ncbi:hypothetical protein DENSPDRAFT_851418 [Dentipellis sp. KUC8613]|nr:hypothetical protein DENSPDRAFT_851418 [Dentipellis sp. KUC8613]
MHVNSHDVGIEQLCGSKTMAHVYGTCEDMPARACAGDRGCMPAVQDGSAMACNGGAGRGGTWQRSEGIESLRRRADSTVGARDGSVGAQGGGARAARGHVRAALSKGVAVRGRMVAALGHATANKGAWGRPWARVTRERKWRLGCARMAAAREKAWRTRSGRQGAGARRGERVEDGASGREMGQAGGRHARGRDAGRVGTTRRERVGDERARDGARWRGEAARAGTRAKVRRHASAGPLHPPLPSAPSPPPFAALSAALRPPPPAAALSAALRRPLRPPPAALCPPPALCALRRPLPPFPPPATPYACHLHTRSTRSSCPLPPSRRPLRARRGTAGHRWAARWCRGARGIAAGAPEGLHDVARARSSVAKVAGQRHGRCAGARGQRRLARAVGAREMAWRTRAGTEGRRAGRRGRERWRRECVMAADGGGPGSGMRARGVIAKANDGGEGGGATVRRVGGSGARAQCIIAKACNGRGRVGEGERERERRARGATMQPRRGVVRLRRGCGRLHKGGCGMQGRLGHQKSGGGNVWRTGARGGGYRRRGWARDGEQGHEKARVGGRW